MSVEDTVSTMTQTFVHLPIIKYWLMVYYLDRVKKKMFPSTKYCSSWKENSFSFYLILKTKCLDQNINLNAYTHVFS